MRRDFTITRQSQNNYKTKQHQAVRRHEQGKAARLDFILLFVSSSCACHYPLSVSGPSLLSILLVYFIIACSITVNKTARNLQQRFNTEKLICPDVGHKMEPAVSVVQYCRDRGTELERGLRQKGNKEVTEWRVHPAGHRLSHVFLKMVKNI